MKYRHALIAGLALAAACGEEPVAPGPSFAKQPPPPSGPAAIDLSNNGAMLGRAVSIDEAGWILGWPASNEGVLIWGPGSDGVPGGAPQPTDPLGDIRGGNTNRYGDAVGGLQDWGLFAYLVGTDAEGQRVYLRAGPLANEVVPGWNNVGDINDDRVIVGAIGSYVTVWPAADASPVLWTSSPYPAVCGGSAPYGAADALNNHGFMVGRLSEQIGPQYRGGTCSYHGIDHAWTWQFNSATGTIESLGELPRDPTAEEHQARNVNDDGVIVGWVYRRGNHYPARWAPDASGRYTRPPTVLPYFTFGSLDNAVVNKCGFMAGAVRPSGSGDRGFVWDGVVAPILLSGLAGSSYSAAMDINDRGDVVGYSGFTSKTGSDTRRPTLWRNVVPPCP